MTRAEEAALFRAITKAKAKVDTATIAVYDADGNLIGTVLRSAVTMLGSPRSDDQPAQQPAQAQPEQPPEQVAANTGAEVAKALAGVSFSGQPCRFTKSAANGDLDQRFAALLAMLPPLIAGQVQDAVAFCGTSLAVQHGFAGQDAAAVAKSAAVSVATRLASRPAPDIDEVVARVGRAFSTPTRR